MLQETLHALRHSMHDLAWRHQKSVESQLALNQAMLQRLSTPSPSPAATPPRQPAHPPPESMIGRKAPVAETATATEPVRATPKLQPRVTAANKPPMQPPRIRTPPPANRPPAQSAKDTPPVKPPAQSAKDTPPAKPPAQRLLCPKPNNAVPPKQLPPQGRGRPKTDCHLHRFLVVIQQSCSLH